MVRDRATRSLSYNDEQFHILERIKITETGRRVKTLLETECENAFSQLAENLGDWYKISQTVYLQMMILNKDIMSYQQELNKFSENLAIENAQYSENVKKLLEVYDSKSRAPDSCKNLQNGKLKNSFREVNRIKKEILGIIRENSNLVEQLQMLSMQKLNISENLFEDG